MNILRTTLILRLTRETIEELEDQLLDLQTKIVKELEYSDMPMGSGGKKTSYQEKLLEKRDTINKKIKKYKKKSKEMYTKIYLANKIGVNSMKCRCSKVMS